MKKVGIELGIKGSMESIRKAALIADRNNLDYYFVPETNPKFIGVDAFEALHNMVGRVSKVRLGTGIVNVFSRSKEELFKLADNLYHETKGSFVLGIGTSAPAVVEKMYNIKFEKPISRIKQYTNYLKSRYSGPIYWSVIGDKITQLAAEYADGVIFFLKPEGEITHSIEIIEEKLVSIGKTLESFEIIYIRPTYVNNSKQKARNAARMTIAGYVGANEFYSRPLNDAGYEKEVFEIRESFRNFGLASAAEKVSDKMVRELATFGTIKDCQIELNEFFDRTEIKTIVAGFDLPRDNYDSEFFENLDRLVNKL